MGTIDSISELRYSARKSYEGSLYHAEPTYAPISYSTFLAGEADSLDNARKQRDFRSAQRNSASMTQLGETVRLALREIQNSAA